MRRTTAAAGAGTAAGADGSRLPPLVPHGGDWAVAFAEGAESSLAQGVSFFLLVCGVGARCELVLQGVLLYFVLEVVFCGLRVIVGHPPFFLCSTMGVCPPGSSESEPLAPTSVFRPCAVAYESTSRRSGLQVRKLRPFSFFFLVPCSRRDRSWRSFKPRQLICWTTAVARLSLPLCNFCLRTYGRS